MPSAPSRWRASTSSPSTCAPPTCCFCAATASAAWCRRRPSGRRFGRANPGEAAAELIALAREHGGPDNITAVVLRLDEPLAVDEEVTLVVSADEATTTVLAPEDGPLGRSAVSVEAVTLVLPAGEAVTTVLAPLVAPPDPPTIPDEAEATTAAGTRQPDEAGDGGDGDDVAGAPPDPPFASAAPAPGRKRRLGCLAVVLALFTVVAGAARSPSAPSSTSASTTAGWPSTAVCRRRSARSGCTPSTGEARSPTSRSAPPSAASSMSRTCTPGAASWLSPRPWACGLEPA